MNSTGSAPPEDPTNREAQIREISAQVSAQGPEEGARMLATFPPDFAASTLEMMNPATRQDVFDRLDEKYRQKLLAATSPENRQQWMRNDVYAEGTVGRLMEPALAIFQPGETIADAIAELRVLVKQAFITYAFVTDETGRLQGVVAMRELAVGEPEQRLDEIMVKNPFFLTPHMTFLEAMRGAVFRHFPAYPVCDSDGRLLGVVRGQMLFEAETIELSGQAGAMVGVEREERLATPWPRSLKFRHPWLQLNLLTAFVAAAVVGLFEDTLERIVLLAVFLPVLAGQSGNTGCQALAVTLRGMTLGEAGSGGPGRLVAKEALLGLLNGALVGVSAGIGMFVYAHFVQKHPAAVWLAIVVFLAMIGSCVISGVSGVLVPMTLRKFGFDPATASSIFLTTATDVASMGTFLGLATLLIR